MDFFRRNRNDDNTPASPTSVTGDQGQGVVSGLAKDQDIFKAYIPNFLYKPPFGMPRRENTPQMKELSKNPYVFSVIKTISDEATSVGWEIKIKEEFQMTDEDKNKLGDMTNKIKEITQFFKNPNGNEESFNHLLRQVIADICEVDSGVFVKVFNTSGEFVQLFARDGSLFLKNPDIYGYIGNKRDFVAPLPDGFSGVALDVGGTPTVTQQQILKQYSLLFKEDAAYFQYGWTAGSLPVPFGKREIVYIMQNPRSDSIYGRSPVQILTNTIFNLIYGIDFNLDYFTNNNMPSGAIQLLGAQQPQITQFRENFENQFKFTDDFGNARKKFFKFPISSSEVKFTPFQLSAKDMDIIAQQQWFTKILWMSFGVTADEMGFTENSNRATTESQIKVARRKAVGSILKVIQYHINTQIIPEFFTKPKDGIVGDMPPFGDIPLQFEFDIFDVEEDMKDLTKLQMEINMGIKTPEMVAKERGINLEELEESKQKKMDKVAEENPQNQGLPDSQTDKEEPKKEKDSDVEEKAINPTGDIEKHIDNLGKEIVKQLEATPENDFQNSF